MRTVSYETFRNLSTNQQVWNVDLMGEGSIDVGGPYRESLTLLCQDLMSDCSPLFVKCPNGKNNVGLNREKYTINPSSTSPLHMLMYEFIGAIIGLAIRTKYTISLDLPSMFWKLLISKILFCLLITRMKNIYIHKALKLISFFF